MNIERVRIPVGDGCDLEGVVAWPPRPEAFGIAVPLVGGTGPQQIGLFRSLVRGGTAVASFTFRGHRGSGGTFSLPGTVTDTAIAIEALRSQTVEQGLPLHLLGTSYATIPLILNLEAHPEWGVRSFIVVSGFAQMADFVAPISVLLSRYAQALGVGHTANDLVRAVRSNPAVVDRMTFYRLLVAYLSEQFPAVSVTTERFEVLEYGRADLVKELQSFGQEPLTLRTRIHSDLPCLWVHALRDEILAVTDEASRRRYRRRISRAAPMAEVYEADIDHWGRGPDHDRVTERFLAFIRAHNQPVPR